MDHSTTTKSIKNVSVVTQKSYGRGIKKCVLKVLNRTGWKLFSKNHKNCQILKIKNQKIFIQFSKNLCNVGKNCEKRKTTLRLFKFIQ